MNGALQPGLVSVMMPAYNAAPYIAEAIESVVAQTYPDWELLVVDDGSTDGTAEIAASFGDPRIRVFRKPNGGESSARNMALDHARGEFLAYLDADDAYLPEHLALTVAYLQAHRDRDAVYTDGIHIDEAGRRLTPLQSRRRGPFEGRIFAEVVRASDVFGPPMCVVIRRALVVRHRLRYDERIVIGPDWDFFVRVAEVATFGYAAARTGFYRVHRSNITAQVDPRRRAASLAICREKAVRMPAFAQLPLDVRIDVFYDLLVTLLRHEPERRAAILALPAFAALPDHARARLLRLSAADALARGRETALAGAWLQQAARLNPADRRGRLLARLYRLTPAGCRLLLRLARARRDADAVGPFGDLLPLSARGNATIGPPHRAGSTGRPCA